MEQEHLKRTRLLVQKNNKKGWNEHLFVTTVGGAVVYVVRLEAMSYRTNYGKNSWDVFFTNSDALCVKEGIQSCQSAVIARYDGQDKIVCVAQTISTPLGLEIMFRPVSLSPVPWEQASPEMIKFAAAVAIDFIDAGFGPHGEIPDADKIRDWAEKELHDFEVERSNGAVSVKRYGSFSIGRKAISDGQIWINDLIKNIAARPALMLQSLEEVGLTCEYSDTPGEEWLLIREKEVPTDN